MPHTWCNVGSSCISGSGKAWRVVKVVCSELNTSKGLIRVNLLIYWPSPHHEDITKSITAKFL